MEYTSFNTGDLFLNPDGLPNEDVAGFESFSKPGYDLSYWSTDQVITESSPRYYPGDSYTVPAGETDLYAFYELKSVSLSFIPSEEQFSSRATLEAKMFDEVILFGLDAVSSIEEFQRDGYEMVGWNTEPDFTGTSYELDTTFTISIDGLRQIFIQFGKVFHKH